MASIILSFVGTQDPYSERTNEEGSIVTFAKHLAAQKNDISHIFLLFTQDLLDRFGRTIMVLHAELAYRARISIDWKQTDKTDYLNALTIELNTPGNGHLDRYLQPFILGSVERQRSTLTLKSLKGLGSVTPRSSKKDLGGR